MNKDLVLQYGEAFAEKVDVFRAGLKEINKRHEAFFASRKNAFTGKEPDHLDNHYIFTVDIDPGIRFWFKNESDLPIEIRKECVAFFNRVFNQTQELK